MKYIIIFCVCLSVMTSCLPGATMYHFYNETDKNMEVSFAWQDETIPNSNTYIFAPCRHVYEEAKFAYRDNSFFVSKHSTGYLGTDFQPRLIKLTILDNPNHSFYFKYPGLFGSHGSFHSQLCHSLSYDSWYWWRWFWGRLWVHYDFDIISDNKNDMCLKTKVIEYNKDNVLEPSEPKIKILYPLTEKELKQYQLKFENRD